MVDALPGCGGLSCPQPAEQFEECILCGEGKAFSAGTGACATCTGNAASTNGTCVACGAHFQANTAKLV